MKVPGSQMLMQLARIHCWPAALAVHTSTCVPLQLPSGNFLLVSKSVIWASLTLLLIEEGM